MSHGDLSPDPRGSVASDLSEATDADPSASADAPGAVDGTLLSSESEAGDPGACAVKVPTFEGPLDLLLHLIRQNEVEITDIPIAMVSQQYLEFLELMEELNLDVAGDYLVMAATLALLKSRMLLPPEETDEEEESLDPRTELVARLLEYQRFKEVAEALGKRRRLGRDVFHASGPGAERTPEAEREIEVGLFELLEAFQRVLAAAPAPSAAHEVESEAITVRERMLAVMDHLERVESLEFFQIFERDDGELPGRPMVVATFLALLELARLEALHIYQGVSEEGAPLGPIRLRRREIVAGELGLDDTRTWSERISEFM